MSSIWKRVSLGIAFALGFCMPGAYAQQDSNSVQVLTDTSALNEQHKVEQLIAFIGGMKGATFIRNGSTHSCREAAEHLRAKWQKHQDKVKTAEGFIDKLASGSGLTGEIYKIRLEDGREVTTREVLTRELKRLQQQ